jgi:hypothetical protein
MKDDSLTMNQDHQDNQSKGKPYEAPKIIRVSLRPDEAVLGHCKIPGSAGPVSGSCMATSCKTFGS